MPDLSARKAKRRHDLDRALETLYFAFRSVTAGPDAVLAERGLSRAHHRILFFIAKNPGVRVSELLATLRVSKQALNAPLRELTSRGLVADRADVADRRVKRLRLTPQGAALEDRLSREQRDHFARVFRRLGKAKEHAWYEVMEALAG